VFRLKNKKRLVKLLPKQAQLFFNGIHSRFFNCVALARRMPADNVRELLVHFRRKHFLKIHRCLISDFQDKTLPKLTVMVCMTQPLRLLGTSLVDNFKRWFSSFRRWLPEKFLALPQPIVILPGHSIYGTSS
jgi:hypothetical protein